MDSEPVRSVTQLPLTGIVIPVREAETLVRSRMLQTQPALLPRDRSAVAHITLLAPFHAEADLDATLLDELAGFFADITAFDFSLTEICQFPGGVTYLSPEPAGVFRRLTTELHRAFPEFPPYGGAFDDVVPHLTVPLPAHETTADLRAVLGRELPIRCRAVEAQLVHVEEDATHLIATFGFGTTAA